jgi:hypothetical protein
MNLGDYFKKAKGLGVLATADAAGKVDVAIYGRPHVIDEETVAFIMADHQSYKNVASNPRATYLFVKDGKSYVGKRLYLTKVREETDAAKIQALRRRKTPPACDPTGEESRLVFFHIEKTRPLVGDGDATT